MKSCQTKKEIGPKQYYDTQQFLLIDVTGIYDPYVVSF